MILGCGQPHGPQGHNIARVAALRAGLPVTTPGVTVNRFCNSGLQAIVQAAHMILQEGVEAAIGGGVESITMMQRDSSPNPWVEEHVPGLYMVMGETAEVVAKRYGVSREAQDEYALVEPAAHGAGAAEGFFAGELAPMHVTRAMLDKKTGEKIGEEECASIATSATGPTRRSRACPSCRRSSTRRAATGSVTAGNSSQLSDGASATLVMSRERAEALGITPLLVFRGYAVAGVRAGRDGHRPGVRRAEAAREARAARRRHRSVGAERSVRVAGGVLPRPARHADGPAERQRRLDRHRPSVRHDRIAPGRHDRERDDRAQARATAS